MSIIAYIQVNYCTFYYWAFLHIMLPMDTTQKAAREYLALVGTKKGWKPSRIASEAGVSASTLNRFLNNPKVKHSLSARTLDKIEAASGIPWRTPTQQLPEMNAIVTQTSATLINHAEMSTDLPVYGTVECGDGDHMAFTDTFLIKRPPVWQGRDDVYAVKASGESMVPRFFPGETVFVDTKIKPRHGCEVVVQLHDGNGGGDIQKALLKVYLKKTPTIYLLSSYNPDYEQNIEIPVDQVKSVDVVVPAGELYGR